MIQSFGSVDKNFFKLTKNVGFDGILSHAKNQHRFQSPFRRYGSSNKRKLLKRVEKAKCVIFWSGRCTLWKKMEHRRFYYICKVLSGLRASSMQSFRPSRFTLCILLYRRDIPYIVASVMLYSRDIPCFVASVMLYRRDIHCFVASVMRYRCDIPCYVPFVMLYRRYILILFIL